MTQADQYTESSWTTAVSILALANSLDIDTTWITNQQTFGAWDNQVSVIAEEANSLTTKNKLIGIRKDAYAYDEALIPELKIALRKNKNNKLIFLHLQGSHASYCSRFPKDSSPFAGKPLSLSEYGSLGSNSIHGVVNCYDNSIYYTDQVIREIISILEDQSEPSSLLYFSDHSENVFGGRAHNKDRFSFDMTEIPMFFWGNNSWKQNFPAIWKNISVSSDEVFTNDHIFEMLSGLLGISSKAINTRNDPSSQFFEAVENPLTQLGYKKLATVENWQYWQDENSFEISKSKDCSKILPHRANTLGKIKSVLSSRLCGFEIDVLPQNLNNSTVLSVGHGLGGLTENNLKNVLDVISAKKASKLWLDIKNINRNNVEDTLFRLNELDELHDIKSRAIVETSYHGIESKIISEAGYQLSYYLPTSKVLEAKEQDESFKKQLSEELIRRVEVMQPRAISFDLRLYPFVKKYMEPYLDTSLSYHTWFPENLNFSTPDLLGKLTKKIFYKDPRVKTVLVPYRSQFEH